MKPLPRIKIAEPQRGNTPGTWAHKTVSTRFSNTAKRIFIENELSSESQERLQALIDDIPTFPIRLINDVGAPDMDAWKNYVNPYLGLNWYQPPWFFTEHYFYRRILEATGYFQSPTRRRVDPFKYQKSNGLVNSQNSIKKITENYEALNQNYTSIKNMVQQMIFMDLWGNQADLSLWPTDGNAKPDHIDLNQARKFILIDNVGETVEYIIKEKPLPRVDFLIDNAGFELVADLVFADFLLTAGLCSMVRLHLKQHPTFVSDATIKDVQETIQFMCENTQQETQTVGIRLNNSVEQGKLQLSPNWFWTSPLAGWEMPNQLFQELEKSSLVISKGDANYRRLLGDRHWEYTTPFDDILSYFPTNLLALRTLKSELIVGLEDEQGEIVLAEDPDWLVDGRWGTIQLYKKNSPV